MVVALDSIGSWKDLANHLFARLSTWVSWNYRASHGGDPKVYIGQLDEWNTQILPYSSSCKVSWKSARTSKMWWINSNVDGYLCSYVWMQMYFALYRFGIMLSLLFNWLLNLQIQSYPWEIWTHALLCTFIEGSELSKVYRLHHFINVWNLEQPILHCRCWC